MRNGFLISLKVLEREMAFLVQRNLFVADQRDGGVGGGGTGSGRRGFLNPLGMRTCDHQKESENKQGMEKNIFSHNQNLTTSGIISRVYL